MKELRVKLNPKQEQFMRDKHRYVAYGGARGGGKSWAVRTKAVILAGRWPGIKILIIRRTYQELRNNHINELRSMMTGVAKYNDSHKIMTFPNGSTIQFGYCACDADVMRYQGAEYDVIFMDEAGQMQEDWIKAINACVRGVNNFPKRTYYTLNPGGPSHGYFKRLFIDRRFEENERPEDYSFIQANVYDNKALMEAQPEYVRDLEAQPERRRRMWLYGEWDIFAGQVFEEFRNMPDHYQDRRWTHVIEPFDIPAGWKIYRSYDFGYAKPFSCAWWAVDYDGVIYRILELYGCRNNEPNVGVCWTPDVQFQKISEIENTHPWLKGREIHGVADPSIWDKSRGDSIYDTALKYRVYFTPGDNERIPGWMQVHYRMAFDGEGYPMMYVFKGCQAFIRTIPLLMYDEHHLEDLDTSMEDHVADEVRYFCMSRPIKPRMDVPKPVVLYDPLEQVGGNVGKFTDARRILHG